MRSSKAAQATHVSAQLVKSYAERRLQKQAWKCEQVNSIATTKFLKV